MIDLHNHILPNLDDGARNMAEAIAMAKAAVDSGTTALAATPHRFWHGKEIEPLVIQARVDMLQAELQSSGIPLVIIPGSEIPMGPDVVAKILDGRLMRYGGGDGTHALIEIPFERLPPNAISIVEQLAANGITPILAHPERSAEVQQDLAFVETASALGAMIQLTSGSILGHFGERPQRTAQLIASHADWRIVIASDAHWAHDRTPSHLVEASAAVAAWIGDDSRARWMIQDGPQSCIPVRYRP